MNASSIKNLGINLSNGWIISCSILTCGIITCAYLNGISDLQLLHMKRKYKLEQERDKHDNLDDDELNDET